jgi:hypothetical protein
MFEGMSKEQIKDENADYRARWRTRTVGFSRRRFDRLNHKYDDHNPDCYSHPDISDPSEMDD